MKALSWTNFALGLWLVIAPFALLYRGIQAALWDDVVVGLLIAAYSLWRALEIEQMIVLLYRGIQAALWDDIVVGLLIAAYSFSRALEVEKLMVGNWIVGALGLWALVSPFVLHFSGAPIAMRNNVIVGDATILTMLGWLRTRGAITISRAQ